MVPDTQETVHVPAEHTWPDGQARPQEPQLERSLVRSRQTPEQLVVPDPQETVHVPAEHTWPDGHMRPQAPQLRRSVASSRQVPEQST